MTRLPLPAAVRVEGGEGDPLAARSLTEPPHPYRTPFGRDAARVLHSRAFRRLAGKTQVFTALAEGSQSDHFRSRLTHTLEVTQIARTLAGALGLNAELAEALALVHDIGHPPFGHAGEKALDRCLRAHGLAFDHNLHALRIVTWFEERYAAMRGLNLTLAVREGIVKHSRDLSVREHPELAEYFLDRLPPVEAQLIDLADEFAYLTADFDDGLDSGILLLDEVIEQVPLFRRCHVEVVGLYPAAPQKLAVNETLRRMLNVLVTGLLAEISSRVERLGARTLDDIRGADERVAALGPALEQERAGAKAFLYSRLYNSADMERTHEHAAEVLRELFKALMSDPDELPADHRTQIPAQGLARTVADYIAGMTDSFIQQIWRRLRAG